MYLLNGQADTGLVPHILYFSSVVLSCKGFVTLANTNFKSRNDFFRKKKLRKHNLGLKGLKIPIYINRFSAVPWMNSFSNP